jgi:hypothetical protein
MLLMKLLLALLLIFAPTDSFASACRALTEPLLLSQLDQRLNNEGLWHDGNSLICGPVCIVNGLTIIRRAKNLTVPEEIGELKSVLAETQQTLKNQGFSERVTEGTNPGAILESLRTIFKKRKIDAEIDGHLVWPQFQFGEEDFHEAAITSQDFKSSPEHPKLTMIQVFGGPKSDPFIAVQPTLAHWMLVTAYNDATKVITIKDPFKPNTLLTATLMPLDVTYQLEFSRPLLSELVDFHYIVKGVITIKY